MKFRFDLKHACIALTLLCIEVLIAVFVHDRYIRPFIGDVLVVMMIQGQTSRLFEVSQLMQVQHITLHGIINGLQMDSHFN